MSIGIIGMGNLGTAVGNMIAHNGHSVTGWEYNPEVVDEINQFHRNNRYLAGIELHPNVRATKDLAAVCRDNEVLFLAIPSVFVQPTLKPVSEHIHKSTIIVNMAKGIDRESGLTSFQTISCMFPDNPRVMLSGPSIANEFAREMPTVVMLAGEDSSVLLRISRLLDNAYFRTRFSEDVIGVELGGILKNIYSIGLGLFDGKEIRSINFRAVYLTIALEEIAKIGEAMGADIVTFLYLAGMGDLLATSMSEHSHNRSLGQFLAEGFSIDEVKEKMGVLPEGYNTLQAVLYITEKLHISVPLAKGLWDVINGRYEADRFIDLFIRDFVE